METKNKYTKFETLLQEKISKHEMPYDNKEWLDFEKKLNNLPKSSFFPNKFYRFAIISASVIIPVLAILYFTDKYFLSSETPEIKIQTQISNNKIKSNYSNVTESNNNSKSYINNQSSQNNQNIYKSNTNFNITPTHSISNISLDEKKLKIEDEYTPKTEENKTISFDNENDKLNDVQFLKEVIFSDVTEGCVPLKVMFKPLIVSE
ncbi:MAG: hypothetical protein HGB12_00990, partial [Bacteroidetes bacterium]|nr:hypothetical protein [Bacteroidota bacterium]